MGKRNRVTTRDIAEELGISEDAFVVGVLGNLAGLADPVVEGQIVQAVAVAGGDLEGLHHQHEHGHHHQDCQALPRGRERRRRH